MNCPNCFSEKTRVVDTGKGVDETLRKYRCSKCEEEFYTIEFDFPNAELAKELMKLYRKRGKDGWKRQ